MAQLLAQCEVKASSDIVRGLFLCAWSVRVNKEQKRLQPEPLAFCTALIAHYMWQDPVGVLVPGGCTWMARSDCLHHEWP